MSEQRIVVSTDQAPSAVGPYSQGIAAQGMVFSAGQIPINPATGKIETTTVAEQTERVLLNLKAVLEAAGSGLDRLLKTTVFMTDLSKFGEMNEVYARFCPNDPPARSAVQVTALPLGAMVEIEGVALVTGDAPT